MPTKPRELTELDKYKMLNAPIIFFGTLVWILAIYGLYCLITK